MGSYLGWGGKQLHVETDMNLGRGKFRTPKFGIRRAFWDMCFGYVSGFKWSAIAYFVLTRSLSKRVRDWALRREGYEFQDGLPVARIVYASASNDVSGN